MTKGNADFENTNVLEAKEVATIKSGAQAVTIGGVRYEVQQQVNLPTLKHETGETIAVKIIAPIREEVQYKEKQVTIDGIKQMVKEESIINVGRVLEMHSNQLFEYVYNAMTADNIRNAYPDESYVGRYFGIQKLDRVAGKQYKQTNVVELAVAG